MSNIPDYLNKLRELNQKKLELEPTIKEYTDIDAEIKELTQKWQDICSHPKEYITEDGTCAACGYTGEVDESVSS